MPLAQIGVILGNFAGMGKKTPCAGTEHNAPVSSRDKQKTKQTKNMRLWLQGQKIQDS